MTSLAICTFTLLVVPIMLQAGATPPLPLPDPPALLPPALMVTATPSFDSTAERSAGKTNWSASQGQLARGIEAAYTKAHAPPAEEVTSNFDGADRVYRIKTSSGVNMCLNWRDVDRFDPGKGKALFVLACNR
jgi:hypothetical protein